MTDLPEGVERLPDGAVVLRGGVLSSRSMDLNCRRVHAALSIYGICVASYPALSAEQIALEWDFRGEHYKESTAEAIRSLGVGFDVIHDYTDMNRVHAILVIPSKPDEPTWDAIRSKFPGEKLKNPRYVTGEGGG